MMQSTGFLPPHSAGNTTLGGGRQHQNKQQQQQQHRQPIKKEKQAEQGTSGGPSLATPHHQSAMAHHSHSPFARRLTKGIRRLRFLVIAFWVAVVALGLVFGLRFLDATVSDFPAPKGRCVALRCGGRVHGHE